MNIRCSLIHSTLSTLRMNQSYWDNKNCVKENKMMSQINYCLKITVHECSIMTSNNDKKVKL